MNIGQVIHFHNERFFEGAVQLNWVQRRVDQARQAAAAFVFHGPRYHGAGEAESEGIEGAYKLKDTASFVRDLLGSMQPGAGGREVNPFWLVVAGYGSGKSHLALTCAMLLAEPQGTTAQIILDQIARADAEIGKAVAQQVAMMAKPALVLPLDGMAGFHLGNALSRAVFEQLRRHGVDAGAIRDLSPRFQTAEQFVARNFSVRAVSFSEYLPGLDAEEICARLREHDEAAYTAVDAVYTEANGHPIPVEGQESAQELIETLCGVYCGPEGPFSHVVILFDELGRYLEYASEKPQLAGDYALQQIFQGVQDNSAKVRFIGFIQYELKAYLKRFSGVDLRQLQRYVTRFDAADKWYLSTNLETLFAHMIGKDEAILEPLWQQTGAERRSQLTWRRLSQVLPGFGRFPVWSKPERFAEVIARGCWPLHPFAVWFLTRQRDLVQSRSALTFIKEVIERIASESAQVDGRLRQVSAADLVVGSMLPELISAERETGGAIAETLQMLLEKLRGHLDARQQRLLAGVAVLEKTRIGKQPRETVDALLCEATALQAESLPALLDSLSELGAMEWNSDLGQYELLSEGATRGQFQQWLRAQQSGFKAEGIRNLFVRRGAADIELGDITPDFAQRREISTPDWFFEAQLAHANTVENAIRSAFEQWRQATLPKDAKGKLIYLYLHPDDEPAAIGERVRSTMERELARAGQSLAPIWVIGIADRRGALAEHIARLYLFDEKLSVTDQERFRRFIPDEREQSHTALNDGVQVAIKERLYWIAGFSEVPVGRLRTVAQQVFSTVYPRTIPFPFDGFATANGGGAVDAAQLMRGLIARQVNGPWVQAQPKRLQNRVDAVLVQSWKALLPSGKLVAPTEPSVGDLYRWLEQTHSEDPQRTLLTSYRAVLAPPYGLNAASAGLLLSLLLGLDYPPRRIEQAEGLVGSAEWLGQAFPSQKGKHHLDEDVLAVSRLRFLSEDSEGRWRTLLNRWEMESNYSRMVQWAQEAKRMYAVDPLPEALEGNYKYLRDKSQQAATALLETEHRIREWERGIEKAVQQESVHHAIKLGSQVLCERMAMVESGHWSDRYLKECDDLLALVREVIVAKATDWIPQQICYTAMQVTDFRWRAEKDAEGLEKLGFPQEAKALKHHTQQSIRKVEERQQFSLTLAQCNDYPRQPEPMDSTSVRTLRDEIARGNELIKGVQGATAVLSQAEMAAHVNAIKQRQEKLQAALKRQQAALSTVYKLRLSSQQQLQEALTRVKRLREIFVNTPDESEVNSLAIQLERILADFESWDVGDIAVERLEELLTHQVEHQLVALGEFLEKNDIEPAWDMTAIYQALAHECLEAARRRSAEWMQPRLALAQQIASLDRQRSVALAQELAAAPAYLSVQHAAQVGQLLESVHHRLAELDELERSAKVAAWQQRYFDLGHVERLDRYATEQLLQELRHPPCVLRPEEQAVLAPMISRLTAHLDQMSVDELFARIERLAEPQQRELLARLSALLEGVAATMAE
ncbi:MAG TPA: hypothetical protein P5260_12280 [Candidatus Competibacter sp.]|nr:hypothetical protein [Candidatus Competibacter sp.]